MNLILLEPADVGGGDDIRLSDTRARHLLNVLKVEIGHQVRVGIVGGPCGVGTVQSVSRSARRTCCCGRIRCRQSAR